MTESGNTSIIGTTKTCPACKMEIPKDASKCPHCHSDLRSWFKRHQILTVLLVGLSAPVLLLLVASEQRSSSTTRVGQTDYELTATKAPTREEKQIGWVTITGNVGGGILEEKINVWQKAGSGGIDNMAIGRVPHNTKVKLLEIKTVDGRKFYHITSTTGEYSVLSTNFNTRKQQMAKKPESEWYIKADEDFVIDGWVVESFVEPRP